MQHVVNIAFDFDDDKIRSIAESSVETELDKIVKDIILDQIAPMTKPSYYSNNMEREFRELRLLFLLYFHGDNNASI